jgi:hypothetical protein
VSAIIVGVVDALGAAVTWVFDLLLAPFAGAPLAGLLAISVVAGVLMVPVFRATTSQAGLRRAAGRARALALSLRLFKDDLRVALRCQAELLAAIALRLVLALPAFLVLAPPVLIVLVQLALRYEHTALAPGETAIVEVQVTESAWPTWRDASLEAPPGVRVETPALRDERERTVSWRIGARHASAAPISAAPVAVVVRARGGSVEKTIAIAPEAARLVRVAARRPGPGAWDRLMHPGERGLPAGPVRAIEVHYPPRATPLLGWDAPWWLTFLIASMAAALVAKPILRVDM